MCYAVLPRLSWLAPARLPAGQGMTLAQLRSTLEDMFSADDSPVMVAQCRLQRGAEPEWLEVMRGFVVPPQWEARAAAMVQHAVVPV